MTSPVAAAQQRAMVDAAPGQGQLPSNANPITLGTLLNKIKHRHHQSGNFRLQSGRHIFFINVDKLNGSPDSIAKFDVEELCTHRRLSAQHS